MKSFEDGLLETGRMLEGGFKQIGENMSKAIAIITAIIAAVLTFTEIAMPEVASAELTTELAVMLISSYIIYFSLEDAGEGYGKRSEAYIAALEEFTTERKKISGEDIAELRDFCLRYTKNEVEYRKRELLLTNGVTPDEYLSYKAGERVDDRVRAVCAKADRIKPIRLTAEMLTEGEQGALNKTIGSPERAKLLKLILGLVPTTVCMLLTVSLMITAKTDMTVADIIASIIKLLTLPIVALRGYSEGLSYSTGPLLSWIKTKTELIRTFNSQKCK